MSYRKSQPEYGNEIVEDHNNLLNNVSPLSSQRKPKCKLDWYEMLYNASQEIGSNSNQSSPVQSNLSPGNRKHSGLMSEMRLNLFCQRDGGDQPVK